MAYFKTNIGQADWFYGIPPKDPTSVTPAAQPSATPSTSAAAASPTDEEEGEETPAFRLPPKKYLLIGGGVAITLLFLWAIA